MKIGPMIRAAMPHTLEVKAASLYRAVFVDLGKVARCLAAELPAQAHMLDIGGGDGALLNLLFALRDDIRIAMVDVAPSVGRFVDPKFASRVSLHPGITIEGHLEEAAQVYDAVLVSDVMHHIDRAQRDDFLCHVLRGIRPGGSVFVKDVEPGYVRANLGWFCDRYLSGDRGVALISSEQIKAMSARLAPGCSAAEIGLFAQDRPNYIVRISSSQP